MNLAKFLGLIGGLLVIVQVAEKHFGFHLIPKYESKQICSGRIF